MDKNSKVLALIVCAFWGILYPCFAVNITNTSNLNTNIQSSSVTELKIINNITLNSTLNDVVGTKTVIGSTADPLITLSFNNNGGFYVSTGDILSLENIKLTSGSRTKGGAIFNENSISYITNVGFENNSATGSNSLGGAIYNKGTITNGISYATFTNNKTGKNGSGGAIYNIGTIGDITNSSFNNNTAGTGSDTNVGAGAIHNGATGEIGNITDVNFIGNVSKGRSSATTTLVQTSAGAIHNDGIIGDLTRVTFDSNSTLNPYKPTPSAIFNMGTMGNIIDSTFQYEESYFASIQNQGEIGDISGTTFQNNFGGGIYNEAVMGNIINSNFINNTIEYIDFLNISTLYNYSIIGDIINTTFSNNSAYGSTAAGAIYNEGTIGDIQDSEFSSNETDYNGGAIYNASSGTINNISSSTFTDNSATNGGAIYNEGTIVSIAGSEDTRTTFTGNSAGTNGGAIANMSGASIGDITNVEFTSNSSGRQAGAIYNIKGSLGDFTNVVFQSNTATESGGAISHSGTIGDMTNVTYNSNISGTLGGAIHNTNGTIGNIISGLFTNNQAQEGGAIYNDGTIGNIGTNSTNVIFSNNKTTTEDGGAIYNSIGKSIEDLINVSFANNSSGRQGGAIYNIQAQIGNLDNVSFISNTASIGGGAISTSGVIGTLTNVNFSNNTSGDNGGALFNYDGTIGSQTNVTYNNNSAVKGGAISNQISSQDKTSALLESINSGTFTDNTASTHGGVIYNEGTIGNITSGTTFIGNKAGQEETNETKNFFGGAIANTTDSAIGNIDSVTFENNIVGKENHGDNISNYGGAIYTLGSIGNISNSLFKNNTANGEISGGGALFNIISSTATKDSGVIGTITNTTFEGNSATYGAAIYNKGTIEGIGDDTVNGVKFVGNKIDINITSTAIMDEDDTAITPGGGAILSGGEAGSIGYIKNTLFENNIVNITTTITSDIAGVGGYGGALFLSKNGATGNLDNVSFINNKVISSDGSTMGYGGAIFVGSNARLGKINNSLFANNEAHIGGGMYVSINGIIEGIYNTTFTNNIATSNGGVMHVNGKIQELDNATFASNTASYGGAIRITSTGEITTIKDTVFDSNSVSDPSKTSSEAGGALYNQGKIENIIGNNDEITFINNSSVGDGSAIIIGSAGTIDNITNASFHHNTSISGSGTIHVIGKIGTITGNDDVITFFENSVKQGAGIALTSTGIVNTINNVSFKDNIANVYSGAIHNNGSIENIINSKFIKNTTGEESSDKENYYLAGALYNSNTIESIQGSTFQGNKVLGLDSRGGAIYVSLNGNINSITNTIFESNYSESIGGAIMTNGAITTIGDELNKVSFISNSAENTGGGIQLGSSGSINSIINTEFKENTATKGGGIYNAGTIHNIGAQGSLVSFINNTSTNHSGAIYNGTTGTIDNISYAEFIGNIAGTNGGGIYNNNVITNITNTLFNSNTGADYGGAIYNAGTIGNIGSADGIVEFIGNKVTSTYGEGGAIYNASTGKIGDITNSSFKDNTVRMLGGAIYNSGTIGNIGSADGIVEFIGNKAEAAGGEGAAIFNSSTGKIGDFTNVVFKNNGPSYNGNAIVSYGELGNFTDVTFENNGIYAAHGTLYISGTAKDFLRVTFKNNIGGGLHSSGTIGNLNNVIFEGNKEGYALFNSGSMGNLTDVSFRNNNYAGSSALTNSGTIKDLTNVEFIENSSGIDNSSNSIINNIINATFKGGNGTSISGAIYNEGTIGDIIDTTFESNNGKLNGAIFNTGTIGNIIDTTFINNTTPDAIFGAGLAQINASALNIIAKNSDVLFSGNIANNISTAIYSYNSAINLNAGNNSIIINDGITGSNGTININKDGIDISEAKDGSEYAGTTGVVEFNNLVSGNSINLYNGTLKLGSYTYGNDAPTVLQGQTGVGSLSNDVNFTVYGCELTTQDGAINTHNLGNLTFDSSKVDKTLTYSLDVNLTDNASDILTTTSTTGGFIEIKDFNVLSGDFATASQEGFKLQILQTQDDSLQLKLSEEAKNQIGQPILLSSDVRNNVVDTVKENTKWTDKYYKKNINVKTYGNITLGTTDTTNDSIEYKVYTEDNSAILQTYNTLTFVNTSSDVAEKYFIFDSADDIYTAQENIGQTVGSMNIIGVKDGDKLSTVDLNGKMGVLVRLNNASFNIENVKFINGISTTYGGVISQETTYNTNKITIKNSAFINNKGVNGGAIYNVDEKSKIEDITGTLFERNVATERGGAIHNHGGTIGDIKDSIFKENSSQSGGGAINNYFSSIIGNIINTEFINNTTEAGGGAIFSQYVATIGNIINTDFTGNYAKEYGGAIHTYNLSAFGSLIDVTFENNYTKGLGGAIYNTTSNPLNIVALNEDVTFTGNYALISEGVGKSNAIYMQKHASSSGAPIINLNAGEKSIIINDGINGNTTVNMRGNININKENIDISSANLGESHAPTNGVVEFNNLVENSLVNLYNGTLKLGSYTYDNNAPIELQGQTGIGSLTNTNFTVYGGKLSTLDNNTNTHSLSNLKFNTTSNPNSQLHYELDIDIANTASDILTTTSTDAGKIIIDDINFIGGNFDSIDNVSFKVQVLQTQSNNLQLQLSQELQEELATNKLVIGTRTGAEVVDKVVTDTKWNDLYHKRQEIITDYGSLNVTTTTTTNDSIGISLSDSAVTGSNILETYDTLRFVNQSTDVAVKNFIFDSADDVYTSSAFVGNTKGTLNIIGVKDGDKLSTINMNGFYAFNVGTGSTLNLKNVNIINNNNVVQNYSNVSMDNIAHINNTRVITPGIDDAADGLYYSNFIANNNTIENITNSLFEGNSTVLNSNKTANLRGGLIQNTQNSSSDVIKLIQNTKFINNSATSLNGNSKGAALYNYGTINLIDLVTFEGNYVKAYSDAQGSAIYHRDKIGTIQNSTFKDNYVESTNGTAQGGAINAGGTINDITDTSFIDNYAINTNNSSGANGGAIANTGTTKNLTNVTFENNSASGSSAYGGAIFNSGTITNITRTENSQAIFNSNHVSGTGEAHGGAIFNSGTITNITGAENSQVIFDSNYTSGTGEAYGGAIFNNSGTINSFDEVAFTNNYTSGVSYSYGGAIYNIAEINALTNSSFIGNSTTSSNNSASGRGGAIYNGTGGSIDGIDNVTFENNSAAGSTAFGGAIANFEVIGDISNSTFKNNSITGTAQNNVSGGALFSNSKIGNISNTSFINNTATGYKTHGGAIYNSKNLGILSEVTFENNTSLGSNSGFGGAIYNSGTIDKISKGTFNSNKSKKGGAIYIVGSGVITNGIIESTFDSNEATGNEGGAIANWSIISHIADSTFTNNSANSSGGAIYNEGTITNGISNTTFENNTADRLGGAVYNASAGNIGNINTATFTNNSANSSGGAIYNDGTIASITGTENSQTIFSGNSTVNTSTNGGAIYNAGTITNGISYTTFENNSSYYGGAVYNDNGTIGNLTNATFKNNSANNFGGAIANYKTINDITDSTFENNTVSSESQAGGGAIHNEGTIGNIINTTFKNNSVTGNYTAGGAIFNNNTIGDLINVTFENNSAMFAGALGNKLGSIGNIIDSTFINNTALVAGGHLEIWAQHHKTL